MNFSKLALLAILALGSSGVMAEDGAERSRLFVERFKADQEQRYGEQQATVGAGLPAKDRVSGPKSGDAKQPKEQG